jgi:acetolactate synthase-1/2/3 large subunit
MYGTRFANTVLGLADLVLVLGSRLDHGVLGADPSGFARRRALIRVDCDAGELCCRLRPQLPIHADVGPFVAELDNALAARGFRTPQAWRTTIVGEAARWPDTAERTPNAEIDPNRFFDRLGRASRAAKAFVVDAGQHTFFCGQSIKLADGQRYVSSISFGSMGTAIPGAIGAALATGGPVVAISGDGAVQMNIQDLHTVAQRRLPIKFVIMNNRSHGLVRQFQKEILAGRYHATLWDYQVPDLLAVFAAYGIEGRSIVTSAEVDTGLAWLWGDPTRAQVLEFAVDPFLDLCPMVPLGRQIQQMVPSIPPAQLLQSEPTAES